MLGRESTNLYFEQYFVIENARKGAAGHFKICPVRRVTYSSVHRPFVLLYDEVLGHGHWTSAGGRANHQFGKLYFWHLRVTNKTAVYGRRSSAVSSRCKSKFAARLRAYDLSKRVFACI